LGVLNGWSSVFAGVSTKAEYVALSTSAKKAAYVLELISEMGFKSAPLMVYSDNQSAQCLANNANFHAGSKHIDIKYNFVRDFCKKKSH